MGSHAGTITVRAGDKTRYDEVKITITAAAGTGTGTGAKPAAAGGEEAVPDAVGDFPPASTVPVP